MPEFIFKPPNSAVPITVIIPARNEEENIGRLLQLLQSQTYPKNLTQIIVINDHSTDRTTEIVNSFPGIKLIDLKDWDLNSYKKKAIEKGIDVASGELIITTDADCLPPPAWLETMVSFYEKYEAAFIAAPVMFQSNSSLLQIFQSLDFLSLQGITGASVYKGWLSMCNGANLAYKKMAFDEVNGFKDIDSIASGDDMLLMHKIAKKFPGRIFYLKSRQAIVGTQPMKTWSEFFNQRIRWASKARFYDDKRIFWVLMLVYFLNLSFLILFVAGFRDSVYWIWLVIFWAAKTLVELPLLSSVARFYNQQGLLNYFFLFQPLHIIYTILAGFLGQFGKYNWKGRRVR